MNGKRRREYLPGLSDAQRQQVVYFAIYPNLLLSLHPDYVMTHTLWPRAHDRTELVCEWHFHPAELARTDVQIDDAVEFWDLTNKEDWWIAEQSQAGITRLPPWAVLRARGAALELRRNRSTRSGGR